MFNSFKTQKRTVSNKLAILKFFLEFWHRYYAKQRNENNKIQLDFPFCFILLLLNILNVAVVLFGSATKKKLQQKGTTQDASTERNNRKNCNSISHENNSAKYDEEWSKGKN